MIKRRDLLGGALAAGTLAACGAAPRAARPSVRGSDLEDQVWRMMWVGYRGLQPPDWTKQKIAAGRLGAVVLFRHNAVALPGLVGAIAELRSAGPIMVAVTQEGGSVRPLVPEMTEWPAAGRLGSIAEVADGYGTEGDKAALIAGTVARVLGVELNALGVDVNFAPVCDVDTNPANPVIGDRAFSGDAAIVESLARAYAGGLDVAGIIPCGKHFPGHGDTSEDSHKVLPRVNQDAARLTAVELAPFAALARSLPMIMTAHVLYPAWDPDLPATLSPRIVDGVLRRRLGFEGLIITDDLEMGAILGRMSIEDAAPLAVLAGCDALLLGHSPELAERAAAALLSAVGRNPRLHERILRAAARHAALRRRLPPANSRPPLEVVGSPPHRRLAMALLQPVPPDPTAVDDDDAPADGEQVEP